jgi:hypothetical protein
MFVLFNSSFMHFSHVFEPFPLMQLWFNSIIEYWRLQHFLLCLVLWYSLVATKSSSSAWPPLYKGWAAYKLLPWVSLFLSLDLVYIVCFVSLRYLCFIKLIVIVTSDVMLWTTTLGSNGHGSCGHSPSIFGFDMQHYDNYILWWSHFSLWFINT